MIILYWADEGLTMRFTFFDLLIAIVISALVTVAVIAAAPSLGIVSPRMQILLSIPCFVLSYLVISSPLYQWLHCYPLLLPKCPFCCDKNRFWITVARNWPFETLQCTNCKQQSEICCDSLSCQHFSLDGTRFELLWPYSFGGRWRRVNEKTCPEE